MFSLFGWTPALRRMLRGRVLSCGCSVGVYETWSGAVVEIVDAHGAACPRGAHTVDAVIVADDDLSDSPAVPPQAHRAQP